MAEFCNQCSKELFDMPGDFVGLTKVTDWAEGKAVIVLCEGCGAIQVDPNGDCISQNCLRNHGRRNAA